MKQDRNQHQNRGYRFTPDSRPALRLTPKAIAFLEKTEKSHADLVNEEIDLFEQEQAAKELSKGDKLAILMNCSDRLHKRWLAAWDAHQALPVYDVRLNAAFSKLKRITSASSRLTKKIADMLGENDSR